MSAEDFGWKVQVEPLGGARTEVIIDKMPQVTDCEVLKNGK